MIRFKQNSFFQFRNPLCSIILSMIQIQNTSAQQFQQISTTHFSIPLFSHPHITQLPANIYFQSSIEG